MVVVVHRRRLFGRAVLVCRSGFLAICAIVLGAHHSAQAESAQEQDQLFQQMVRNPANHELTFEFVRVATARSDYEAAIGALERLLFYNPRLTRVKYELGALYFRLGSYEMAQRYFREALASPDVDAITKERIETYLPQTEKQLQPSRLSGFVQTGIRSQSNASYAPGSGILRLGGNDLALLPTARQKSDVNWFGLAGVSHDYDLQNQHGDVLETRAVGYLTQQVRLPDLNVGFFDLSFGPRLALAPELLPGATIKPYIAGGNTWLGGSSYFSTIGTGVALQFPVNNRFSFGTDFDWRRADFQNGNLTPVSGFNSGDWFTTGVSGSLLIAQQIKLDMRGLYRRGESAFAFQSFDQWGAEAALTFEFAPPFEMISRNWSVAPFVRRIDTRFDAANPFIDPLTVRRDGTWSVGALFDMPLTKTFGLSTAVQYDRTDSTLPNYRLDNFSVMFGPTARF
ncbi:tetratricopeptide repeat protein [Bradyrhizobium sp. SYSU BS000235]|uniref:tetratricopeptide repeat protein n=1 Tax=Bradyrhizobium sp. SYSU BS000235 TaxID=3411332 RepID=UPI003C721AF9